MIKIVSIDGGFKKDLGVAISAMYLGDSYIINVEKESTIQRAEINALILALQYAKKVDVPVTIISDSSYVTNTVTKQWYVNWEIKGWINANGEPIKNRDLWEIIIPMLDTDTTVLHVNSHILSIGKVAAAEFIANKHFRLLEDVFYSKYDKPAKKEVLGEIDFAKSSFKLMNGVECNDTSFRDMVVYNSVVDSIVEYVKGGL